MGMTEAGAKPSTAAVRRAKIFAGPESEPRGSTLWAHRFHRVEVPRSSSGVLGLGPLPLDAGSFLILV